jgi:nicotinamidase-related amidase
MKKILVVVDMQNDFITGCLGNDECRAVVPKVADVIRTGDYDHVYVTMDTHDENYLSTQEGHKLPVVHCVAGSDGWKINAEVAKALEETYALDAISTVTKESFGSIELGSLIKEHCAGDDAQIDFVGVCTGICVISNVMILKAFMSEAKVCVIEDACACVTPESHKTAIEAMKTAQVDIR